jgi:hypothetical protein
MTMPERQRAVPVLSQAGAVAGSADGGVAA